MAVTTYTFPAWQSTYTFTKWDVVQGAGLSATDSRYFYSTTDGNAAQCPLATFIYTPTQTTRNNNVMRLAFTQTGAILFQPGSIVQIANIAPDNSANYTGVILGAGSGYVDYLNAGLNTTNAVSAGTLRTQTHPYWTTGFAWIPSYSTDITHNQMVYSSQLGEGYSQRMNAAINSNNLTWGLVFDNRTDKEATAMLNFLEDKCGVVPITLPFPVGLLYMNPNLRYVNGPAKLVQNSYNLNTITTSVQQVFDL